MKNIGLALQIHPFFWRLCALHVRSSRAILLSCGPFTAVIGYYDERLGKPSAPERPE